MHDDGPRRSPIGIIMIFGTAVLELKAFRELEVKLNRGTLERSFQSILDGDVNFRAIESPVAFI